MKALRATPLTTRRLRALLSIALAAATIAACASGPRLSPAYQIGRLSDDAVAVDEAGVRLVARTDAWPGPPLGELPVLPVEITVDNRSAHPLRVDPASISLVAPNGARVAAWHPPAAETDTRLIETMRARTLPTRTLLRDERVSGFVYFTEPRDVDDLDLRMDLVNGDTGDRFGQIAIPFYFD